MTHGTQDRRWDHTNNATAYNIIIRQNTARNRNDFFLFFMFFFLFVCFFLYLFNLYLFSPLYRTAAVSSSHSVCGFIISLLVLHCTNLYSFWWYVHDSVRNTKEIIDVNLTRDDVRDRDKRRFSNYATHPFLM